MVEKVRVLAALKPNNLTSFFRAHMMERKNKLPSSLAISLTYTHASSPPCNPYHLRYHQFTFNSSQFVGRFLLGQVCIVCLRSGITAAATKTVPEVFLCHYDLSFLWYGIYSKKPQHLTTLAIGRMASRLGKLPTLGLGKQRLDLNSPMKHSNQG